MGLSDSKLERIVRRCEICRIAHKHTIVCILSHAHNQTVEQENWMKIVRERKKLCRNGKQIQPPACPTCIRWAHIRSVDVFGSIHIHTSQASFTLLLFIPIHSAEKRFVFDLPVASLSWYHGVNLKLRGKRMKMNGWIKHRNNVALLVPRTKNWKYRTKGKTIYF